MTVSTVRAAGTGTSSRLLVPAARPSTVAAMAAAGAGRVLVAEDNPTVRRLLVRVVAGTGATAVEAADGDATVDALTESRFDLLILDLSMPKRHGVDVLRWLRSARLGWPAPRVMILSAAPEEHRPVLEQLGVDALLTKPARLADIAAAVTALTGSGPVPG